VFCREANSLAVNNSEHSKLQPVRQVKPYKNGGCGPECDILIRQWQGFHGAKANQQFRERVGAKWLFCLTAATWRFIATCSLSERITDVK
jgi:hypothetical protein